MSGFTNAERVDTGLSKQRLRSTKDYWPEEILLHVRRKLYSSVMSWLPWRVNTSICRQTRIYNQRFHDDISSNKPHHRSFNNR